MYLILLLFLATFLIWGVESIAHVFKIIGVRSNTALVGNAYAQSLNIVSRCGYFIQTYIIATILDRSLFIEDRLLIILFYLLCVLASSLIVENFFNRLTELYKTLILSNLIDSNEEIYTFPVSNRVGGRLRLLPLVGYVFLYSGAVAPLVLQLVFPSMAARSIALGTILNGVSTILLITVLDLKIAFNTQNKVDLSLSADVYRSKYYASLMLAICILALLILNK